MMRALNEYSFPRFSGPTQLSARPFLPFLAHQRLIGVARGVSQPDPDEVKQLMHQNTSQFSRLVLELLVEHDLALSNERAGVNGLAEGTIGV